MSAEQKIIDAISKIVENMIPANNLIIASVVTTPPSLSVKFGEQTVPSEQLYCSNYLLPNYRRDYRLDGIIDRQHQDVSNYKFDNTTDTEMGGPGPHNHQILKLDGKGTIKSTGDYEHHGEMWWTNTLEIGDEVLLAVVGQFYVVVDRIVKMPNQAIEEGA